MSYPVKSRLRTMVVNGIQYRWRFNSGESDNTLVVYGPISGRQSLSLVLLDWRDFWLSFPEPVENLPKTITPDFVRRAIEFGLANGWQPEKAGGVKWIEWKDGALSDVKSQPTE